MIRLLRSGMPVKEIAALFNAEPEYISRLNERFSLYNVPGILSGEDFRNFRLINPEQIRICSFNLHGIHDGDLKRYGLIADRLSLLDPDICAFQEVISGAGIENTAQQIAGRMSAVTGSYYREHFAECHLFMEKYPEGVSTVSRHQLKNNSVIDLNTGLRKRLIPDMERYSAVSEIEIYGHRVVFASIHLDYNKVPEVRLAQAEKLLAELDRLFPARDIHCFILAGDFNDVEKSPVMRFLLKKGYRDAYRACRPLGGDTYPATAPDARIDYIMVKGDVDFISSDLIQGTEGLSDHIGISAVIK